MTQVDQVQGLEDTDYFGLGGTSRGDQKIQHHRNRLRNKPGEQDLSMLTVPLPKKQRLLGNEKDDTQLDAYEDSLNEADGMTR